MKNVFVTMLALGGFLSLPLDAQDRSHLLVVIVNTRTPLPSDLTADDLQNIFVGKEKFIKGMRLHPVNNGEEDLFERFLEKFIGVDASEYKTFWIKKVFREGGEPPKVLPSSEKVIRFVSKKTGAIGYVWRKDIEGKEGIIKVVPIRP